MTDTDSEFLDPSDIFLIEAGHGFAETFRGEEIVSAVRRQLSWTHVTRLICVRDARKEDNR